MSYYREWADFLNDQKCGGPREREEVEVKIGDKFRVRCYSDPEESSEVQTVDAENIAWFRWALNDRENDMWELERIPPSSQS